jgi:hypothetical protein
MGQRPNQLLLQRQLLHIAAIKITAALLKGTGIIRETVTIRKEKKHHDQCDANM